MPWQSLRTRRMRSSGLWAFTSSIWLLARVYDPFKIIFLTSIDLKAYYRGYRYVTETIKILPQKPDGNLVAQLFHKVAALGRIHPAKMPVSSG